MSKNDSKVPFNAENSTDENQYQGKNEGSTRKRKAETSLNDEHPVKLMRTNDLENQAPNLNNSDKNNQRKRKSAVLEEITNTLNNDDDQPSAKVPRDTLEDDLIFDSNSKCEDPSIIIDLDECPKVAADTLSSQTSETTLDEQSSQENHFDKISDHIIIELMAILPLNDRLALAETSKRFNEILKHNPSRLPIKLTLNFDTDDFPDFERTYRSITIRDLETPNNDHREKLVMKVFDQLCDEAKDVIFSDCTMTPFFLHQVLSTMPKISSLYLGSSTTIDKLPFDEFELLTLTKLKKMIVHDNSIECIASILQGVTTLDEFIFRSTDDVLEVPEFPEQDNEDGEDNDIDEDELGFLFGLANMHFPHEAHHSSSEAIDYEPIKDVLKRQKNLKTLEFSNAHIFKDAFDQFDFELKNIVLFMPWATRKQLKNICDFVESQTKVESVVINILCNGTSKNKAILRRIITHLMKLDTMKAFKIVFYADLGMIEFYRDNLIVNPNIQELYMGLVNINNSYRRIIEATVRHFPNLKKLSLCLDGSWYNNATAETFAPLSGLRDLNILKMEHLKAEFLTQFRCPSLRVVVSKMILESTREQWQQFYANNRNIELLDYQFCPLVDRPDVVTFVQDIAGNLSSVKKIHVCTCGRAMNDDEKEQILAIFVASQSMKAIGFCGWAQHKQ